MKGDEEVEYTFTGGKGDTVIDLVLGDREVRDRVEKLMVGDSVESDHHPLEVWMKGDGEGRMEKGKKREGCRGVWDKKRAEFKEKMGRVETGGRDLEEGRKNVQKKIKEVLKEMERRREGGGDKKGGW